MVEQVSKAFKTESCRVSPPSIKQGEIFKTLSFSKILALEKKAYFASSVFPLGQVITKEANWKLEEIFSSKNAFKKAMQAKDKTVLFSLSCIERYSFLQPVPKRVEEPAAVIIKWTG